MSDTHRIPADRRDAMRTELLGELRRVRRARRTRRQAAAGAATLAAVALVVWTTPPAIPPAPVGSAPGPTVAQAPATPIVPIVPIAPAPGAPTVRVAIVRTDASVRDRVELIESAAAPATISDTQLVARLRAMGRDAGLVRVGGELRLTRDVVDPRPAAPSTPGGSTQRPHERVDPVEALADLVLPAGEGESEAALPS